MDKKGAGKNSIYNISVVLFSAIFLMLSLSFVSADMYPTAVTPYDGATQWTSVTDINFNCTAEDALGLQLANATIYTNITGTWGPQLLNDTSMVSGNGTIWNVNFTLSGNNITDISSMKWTCNFEYTNGTVAFSSNSTLIIDTVVPTAFSFVNITYGANTSAKTNNTIGNSATPRIAWGATTENSFANYTLIISENDTSFTNSDTIVKLLGRLSTNYTLTTALTDGLTYYFKVIAFENDAAMANRSNYSTTITSEFWRYTVDLTNPTFTITYPVNNTVQRNTSAHFVFAGTDTNINTCKLYINKTTVGWTEVYVNSSPVSAMAMKYSETLNSGVYVWAAWCNDSAGNFATSGNYTLTISTTAPIITNSGLASNVTRTGSTVFVTVNTSNNGNYSNVTFVSNVTVGYTSLSTDNSVDSLTRVWNGTVTVYLNTNGTLTITATDNASNSATASTPTIVIDNSAPTIAASIIQADGGGVVNTTNGQWYDESINITLTATEIGLSSVDTISYRTGGSGAQWSVLSGSVLNLTNSTTFENNTFQYRVNDALGNMGGITTVTIKIDAGIPSARIVSIGGSIVAPGASVILAANLSDYVSGINASTAKAWHNGTTGSDVNSTVSLTYSNGYYVGTLTAPTAVKNYMIYVNVTDNAGNVNTTIGTLLTIGNSSTPTLSTNLSSYSYVGNYTTVQFTVSNSSTIQYNYSGVPTLMNIETIANQTYLLNLTINNTFGSSFVANIYVNSSVMSDFVTNGTYTYYFDVLQPAAPSTTDLADYRKINGTINVNVVASDASSGIANVKFYIGPQNGTQYLNYTDSLTPYVWTLDTLKFADGNYTINITATDNIGLTATTAYVVAINNSRAVLGTVSGGVVDFSDSSIRNQVPQITGLNSTNATVIVGLTTINSSASSVLSTTYLYMNIIASTGSTARIYFRIPTDGISSSSISSVYAYADHNYDGTFETRMTTTYVGQVGDYYEFYFDTTGFSEFAVGLLAPTTTTTTTASTSSNAGNSLPTNNVREKSIASWSAVVAGQEIVMTLDRGNLAFTKLIFDMVNAKDSVKLTVASYKSMPSGVTSIDGVYQYLSIDATGVATGDYGDVELAFRVPKSWFAESGVDSNKVSLFRYVSGSWIELATSYVGEDETYYMYTAKTPGFSYFAIAKGSGAAKAVAPTTTVPAVISTPTTLPQAIKDESMPPPVEDNKATTGKATGGEGSSPLFLVSVFVVVILAIVAGYWYFGKKKD